MDITLFTPRLYESMLAVFLFTLSLGVALGVVGTSQANEASPVPTGGQDVVAAQGLDDVAFDTDGPATIDIVPADHPGFERAARVVVERRPAATWSIQANWLNARPIRKGDVMHVGFYARCLESMTGEGFADVKFELNGDPWPQSMSHQISYAIGWKRFDFPFIAERDYAPGEGKLSFQLGYDAQVMELGGLRLQNFGPGFDLTALPHTKLTYPGRETDAAWRAEAQQRIEELRMADLTVTVTDGEGRPVPDAKVHVQMRRHAFRFGSAVVAETLAGPRADAKYARLVEDHFNEVVFENDMKWVSHGFGEPQDIATAMAWLRERDITIRGHVLVWPGWRWLPEELRSLEGQPALLRERVAERVTSTAEKYAGRMADWDVLNEPFNNTDLMDILGDEVMDEWFHLAKAADPGAVRYINDWGILANGGYDTKHQDVYFDVIQGLIGRGAPIQGIGMQGHFGSTLTPPTRLLEIMDRYAATGLRLKITELDIVMLDEELRADYLRDVMTAAFSHPSMDGILLWGFWADRHWKPSAALWDSAWNIRPHGQAWLDLVKEAWWTDEHGNTDVDGAFATRGFLGDYVLTVEHGERRAEHQFTLDRHGEALRLKLP
ncbi:MAG: endo-1,4-beta-xylanase [Planctomycetota bacterium]